MPADCWACAFGLRPIGPVPAGAQDPRNPLGICFDCHVMGCPRHGERDRGAGKWFCYPSVASGLSVSAGLDSADVLPVLVVFRSRSDFEDRFPSLAEATSEIRAGMTRDHLHSIAGWLKEPTVTRHELLVAAVAVGRALLGPHKAFATDRPRIDVRSAFPGRLGDLLMEYPGA